MEIKPTWLLEGPFTISLTVVTHSQADTGFNQQWLRITTSLQTSNNWQRAKEKCLRRSEALATKGRELSLGRL